MEKPGITYENIIDLCEPCNLQLNWLFICFRKTLGLSQRKVAYLIDNEHINQNTISRYEHKNTVNAEYEYILWQSIIKEMNKYATGSKSGAARWIAVYTAAIELYILHYATKKQARELQMAMIIGISEYQFPYFAD